MMMQVFEEFIFLKISRIDPIPKMNQFFLAILLLSGILNSQACSSDGTNSTMLNQANELHLEAVERHMNVEFVLDSLRTRSAGQPNSRLDSLAMALAEWEGRLIEVPGFEDQHDHAGHGHDHHHDSAPELTPDQMLAVQQEFLREIKALEQSLRRIDPVH